MKDKYAREVNYLRLSVTDLCNLKCRYCVSKESVKVKHNEVLSIEQLVSIVKAATKLGINKVRITGGEPLLKHGIVELIKQVSPLVKGNLGMTTNGQLLGKYAQEMKAAGLNSLNVSLDTLDPQLYSYLSFGDLQTVLDGLQIAHKLGYQLKINAVLQKGINDDKLAELVEYAASLGAKLRFIELMPFEDTKEYCIDKYVSADTMIKKYQLKYLYSEGTAQYYLYKGHEVGFIRPISNNFCADCNRIRVTVFGEVLPCLHSSITYSLKPYLADEEQLMKALQDFILLKPKSHRIAEGQLQQIDMIKIGG